MGVGCQVIVALVTIYLLQSTNACRCMPGHPQQEICTRNFGKMTLKSTQLVVLFVFILSFNQSFGDRKCFVGHPQEEICNSDFAFRGTVRERFYHAPRFGPRYIVEVDYNFKGRAGNSVTLYTVRKRGAVNLTVGTRYVITGRFAHGRMIITSCDWIQEWDSVDQCVQEKLLRGTYAANCACQVRYCKPGRQCSVPASEGCGLVYPSPRDKSRMNDLCKVTGRSCIWEQCP